ncbi:MAG: flagellar biosynthesis protein FlhB [Ignavibacteriae bacterium HGW-Ignavibacteriae-3]|nr:MAG: flagellar biosynthesis protein FlhB [Ignavibacteriae bacterium HGW-Ignavibacteriae-3]
MAEKDGQEKSEEPTSKKLSDARDKGEVAKSTEINSLAVFGSGLMIIYLTKGMLSEKIAGFAIDIFSSLEKLELNKTIIQTYALKWVLFLLTVLAPVMLGIVVVALAANIAQVGFAFKTKVFIPKLSRFNPLAGIKRIFFSSRSVIEVGKSVAKLFAIGLFAYFIISKLVEDTTSLIELSIEETIRFMIDAAFSMIIKIVLFFVAIAAIDFTFQKIKFKKDMMMSKHEVKEEWRQSEGDPLIKSKIRRQMLSMARKRMMKDVPTADVVVTNPTHFAIAIKYEMNKDRAPKVVAKGMDELAQRIKKIAIENNVPLHEDKELARALYKATEVGDEIPTKLFKAVAQILAYIFQLKKMKKKRSIV